jgi:hypothetical protein
MLNFTTGFYMGGLLMEDRQKSSISWIIWRIIISELDNQLMGSLKMEYHLPKFMSLYFVLSNDITVYNLSRRYG